MPDYPSELSIKPIVGVPKPFRVRVPGSKSLTNRALIVAALAEGKSTLLGALDSDDTRVMIDSLRRLGMKVSQDLASSTIEIIGCGARFSSKTAELFTANSGTSLRFLTALVAIGKGTYKLDGSPRMRQRPVADLLMALNGLGSDATSDLGTGCPPVTVKADGLDGGYAFVKGDVSSQFLSGLMMVLPYARQRVSVEVEGTLVSKPYVTMTMGVMESAGVKVANHGFRKINVEPARYHALGRFAIEPDASAASYFFGAAAITGGTVTVEGLGKQSLQGDMAFLEVLEHMGCKVEMGGDTTTITGGPLRGVDVDMNAISDTVMTLGAVAMFASGITRIRNVAHIRHKETDRIHALAIELRKLGATVDEQPDGLVLIPPHQIKPARIATYDDHRMAMSLALVGLKAEGVTILDPACVAKTYPGFWTDFEAFLTP